MPTLDTRVRYFLFFCRTIEVCILWFAEWASILIQEIYRHSFKGGRIGWRGYSFESIICKYGSTTQHWHTIDCWEIRHTDAKTLPLKTRQRWLKTFLMPFVRYWMSKKISSDSWNPKVLSWWWLWWSKFIRYMPNTLLRSAQRKDVGSYQGRQGAELRSKWRRRWQR